MINRPGGEMSTRPLHFIWIADCSGSMAGSKIQALNNAIRETIPHMRTVAKENPNAQVLVRVLKFSNGAQWHVAQPTPIEDFKWTDLTTGSITDMGRALSMVAETLKMPPMTDRGLPPVLVLISDGHPTDNFAQGLKALMDQPWGQRAVRIAIGIGQDADYGVLQKFIGHQEIQPLQANKAEDLVKFIQWASTAVLKAASAPNIQNTNDPNAALNALPTIVAPPAPSPSPAKPVPGDIIW